MNLLFKGCAMCGIREKWNEKKRGTAVAVDA